jgi:CelD/BcsL family acetyltransferase involved in cellulose biosynthesis
LPTVFESLSGPEVLNTRHRRPTQSRIRTGYCSATGARVTIRPLADAEPLAGAWRALARRALTQNIFYEPEYAIPASLAFGKGVLLATVENNPGELQAIWPFRVRRSRWGLPIGVLEGWGHPFAALGIPLVDQEQAETALKALLNFPTIFPRLPRRAFLPLVPDNDAFAELLLAVQTNGRLREARTEGHDRAELLSGTVDPYAHQSPVTRSKRRRDVRRLEKLGTVSLQTATSVDDVMAYLAEYLELEASGWKGRAGTAIPQSAGEAAFLTRAVNELAADGRVRVDRLCVDATTVASTITYLSDELAWYAKTSFNEDYAKYSPGSVLVMKLTDALLADPSIKRVDSCAPPHHPLLRSFWGGRFRLSNRIVELQSGDRLFPLAAALEEGRLRLRETTKNLRTRTKAELATWRKRLAVRRSLAGPRGEAIVVED